MADNKPMTIQERWAAEAAAEGFYQDVPSTQPRWKRDGLEEAYGPDAPEQGPVILDTAVNDKPEKPAP